jgi:branched-chain amino acid transport system substrate-binding protein
VRTSTTVRVVSITSVLLLLAGCASPTEDVEPREDLELTIGALLPQTGAYASLAPAQAAGIALAAQDVNQAELGITVSVETRDSGDAASPTVAEASVADLLKSKTTAIVGATSTDVSKAVAKTVTDAGVVMVSPQNSDPSFTGLKDDGLYFRTAPSDVLEGVTLGERIAEDGAESLGIVLFEDDYGTGLRDAVTSGFESAGGTVEVTEAFDATTTDLAPLIADVAEAKPDAVVLITGAQSVSIVPGLVAAGIAAKSLYFVDRNTLQYGADMPVPLEGATGTLAGPVLDPFFEKRLRELNPALTGFAYAPESYDAVVLLALASLSAGSTKGEAIASKLRAVSGGSDKGEKATDFASAAQIIVSGDPVDYDGYSGPIGFDKNGDPAEAIIGFYGYGADNRFTRLD